MWSVRSEALFKDIWKGTMAPKPVIVLLCWLGWPGNLVAQNKQHRLSFLFKSAALKLWLSQRSSSHRFPHPCSPFLWPWPWLCVNPTAPLVIVGPFIGIVCFFPHRSHLQCCSRWTAASCEHTASSISITVFRSSLVCPLVSQAVGSAGCASV